MDTKPYRISERIAGWVKAALAKHPDAAGLGWDVSAPVMGMVDDGSYGWHLMVILTEAVGDTGIFVYATNLLALMGPGKADVTKMVDEMVAQIHRDAVTMGERMAVAET